LDDLNDIERLVAAETRSNGNVCGTCEWLESLPKSARAKWDSIFWDGVDDSGKPKPNRRWHTQAIQRAIVKLAPDDFPKSTVEGHRKHQHPTPGLA
jgi:hypothetical protein